MHTCPLVDRVGHQEEGTSLRDSSVLLIAWSAQALGPGSTGPVFSCHKPLVCIPWVLSYHGVTCVACFGFDPVGVQNFSFAFMTLIYS